MNYGPRVSVVMAAYNSEQYIKYALESLINQTYLNMEIIFIDDGSTDNTLKIVESYCGEYKNIIVLKNDKNMGQSYSWNRGIQSSSGEYIARMDSDDICILDRIAQQVEYMEEHEEIGVLGSSYYVIDKDGELLSERSHTPYGVRDCYPPVHHPTTMIRKELFNRIGLYNSRFNNAEDYELWVRFYANGVKFGNLGRYLLKYRVYGGNVSAKKEKDQAIKAFKISLMLPFHYGVLPSLRGHIRIIEQFLYIISLIVCYRKLKSFFIK